MYFSAGQLAVLLRQSGQGEKAVALFQALLEINLFCPDFSGPGEYGFEDKVRDTYCTVQPQGQGCRFGGKNLIENKKKCKEFGINCTFMQKF